VRRTLRFGLLLFGMIALMVMMTSMVLAQSAGKVLSQDVSLDVPFRGIDLAVGENRIQIGVRILNRAETRRVVNLAIQNVPDGWNIGIRGRSGDFVLIPTDPNLVLNQVAVEGQLAMEAQLNIDLPEDEETGTYTFSVRASSADDPSVVFDTIGFVVKVPSPEVEELGNVSATAEYPVLSGSAANEFEFQVTIRNDTGGDTSFDLRGEVPPNWEISFLPTFGKEKLISSVSVVDGSTQRFKVKVSPPRLATPGNYPIPLLISNDEFLTNTVLAIALTGQGELDASTGTGRLNTDAIAGESSEVIFKLINVGTGALENLTLQADRPSEGWQIDFQVNTVSYLDVNNEIEIPLTIIPPDDAVPGDYLVTLRATHPDAQADLNLRVTVEQSTIWGWLGIVIVILVLGGLGSLFWRLGRR
jgi:uncharacterized membrane protein